MATEGKADNRKEEKKSALRALAHEGRFTMLAALARGRAMTKTELNGLVEMSKENCAKHLRYMAAAGVVHFSRRKDTFRLLRVPLRSELRRIAKLILSKDDERALRLLKDRLTRDIVRTLAQQPLQTQELARAVKRGFAEVKAHLQRLEKRKFVVTRERQWHVLPGAAFELLLALINPTRKPNPPMGQDQQDAVGMAPAAE
jgi:predicted transcriptional regulator